MLTDVSVDLWNIRWKIKAPHQVWLEVIEALPAPLLEMLCLLWVLAIMTVHGLIHLLGLTACISHEQLGVLAVFLVPFLLFVRWLLMTLIMRLGCLKLVWLLELCLLIIEDPIILGTSSMHHAERLRLLWQKPISKLIRVRQLWTALLVQIHKLVSLGAHFRFYLLLALRILTSVRSSWRQVRIDIDVRGGVFADLVLRKHRLLVIVINIAKIFIQHLHASVPRSGLFGIIWFLVFSSFDSLPSFLNFCFNFQKFGLLLNLSFFFLFLTLKP